jgi:ribosomal protein S18 acetylase RimI-like enzyme
MMCTVMAYRPRDIAQLRALIAAEGLDALSCDDFRRDDIERWTTRAGERESLAKAMDQVEAGTVDYITLRGPCGRPLSKCGINYTERDDTGVIYQFDTMEGLRGLGLGTRLLTEAERRIRERGQRVGQLGVELDNLRARSLYERCGYVFSHEEDASWEYLDEAGKRHRHDTRLAILRKTLVA